jgi:hypothetical protein
MEAVRTSETSVDNYFTRQYIPEDNSELHTRRRENLKSHKNNYYIHSYCIDFLKGVSSCQNLQNMLYVGLCPNITANAHNACLDFTLVQPEKKLFLTVRI